MLLKKLFHKLKVSYLLLKNDGIIAVLIRSLEFIQKHTSGKRMASTQSIHTKARFKDILASDLSNPTYKEDVTYKKNMTFTWIMPPPGKGSGGHINIFRFIDFLEKSNHKCEIYLFEDADEHPSIDMILENMGNSYPEINAARSMKWLDNQQLMNSDGIFVTSWETAYASYSLKSTAKRFYFIQDFEPYFYPLGGMYSLAENTYKMGFFGITAGGWLQKKLSNEYDMSTDHFDFGADKHIYEYTNTKKRKEILYYTRPYTARRGFEVGIAALTIFHEKHPDYTINLVGWDVSTYKIPFPYVNLKTLEIDQLSELYNRCAAGLVLSYTNMSLLPLELLSCGTIPVVNDAENNRLVSDNPFIAYSNNDPHSLANKLSEIISNKNTSNYSKKAAKSVSETSWKESGERFIGIIEREMSKNE